MGQSIISQNKFLPHSIIPPLQNLFTIAISARAHCKSFFEYGGGYLSELFCCNYDVWRIRGWQVEKICIRYFEGGVRWGERSVRIGVDCTGAKWDLRWRAPGRAPGQSAGVLASFSRPRDPERQAVVTFE